ncbi:hypothetical protein [Actinoplanes palleronii]|uniref:Uncharacterized protein n=1 Tax=Actinoplanes palleronii TaxID=113570 RepID=A0ABQ4B3Z4_9ACTN|nr:hypothetical protein [Actinoplanes palleronii]GIE65384.1 hypothetical protein Apa02nite_014920 [Actinoplanes palleronii]
MIVDVYPVGLLADLLMLRRALRLRHRHGIPWALRRLIARARRLCSWGHEGNWGAVKNSFNGYLAEPYEFPPGNYRRRCGTGWTRGRALRSLRRQLPADGPIRDMRTWTIR